MAEGNILEGKVLGLEEIGNYFHLKVDFHYFTEIFQILKENCDLLQMHKVMSGTEITCFFLDKKLQRIFLKKPLYNQYFPECNELTGLINSQIGFSEVVRKVIAKKRSQSKRKHTLK